MQTILGSGGAIGTDLAKELINYTDKIRLVSPNPGNVNPGDEVISAGFADPVHVDEAFCQRAG